MKGTVRFSAIMLILFGSASTAFSSEMVAETQHVTVLSSTANEIVLDFNLSGVSNEIITRDGQDYQFFSFSDEGIFVESGKPVLPAVSRFVVVPPQTGLRFVVHDDQQRHLRSTHSPILFEADQISATVDNDDNEAEELIPSVVAEMSEPIVIRGVRLVKVTTYPVQYNPASKTYLVNNNIQTEIQFTDDEPANPVYHPNRRNRSRQFLKYIRALAINGDEVGRDDPDRDTEPEYIGHYLIVTHERCLEFAAPFIEWRRKSGYKVDILSMTSGQAGNPGTVKDLIQDRYDEYVDNDIDPFDEILLIGDRAHYYYTQAANWILRPYRGNPTWGNDDRADYLFACLEGGNNDHHPDVGFSRWHSGSENLMELAVGRTLSYEAEPYMEDTDWFTRGGAYSQHWGNNGEVAWHISIHTNVRWGEEVLKYLGFDDVGFYEEYAYDQQGQRIGPVIEDWLEEGINVMVGRAENYYWRNAFNARDNIIFPINICHSGHGEWCAEAMTRTGDGNHLKGPVAMTYGWGNPGYTAPISACWAEVVNAVLLKDIPLGWARVYGITVIETYFAGGDNYILQNKTDFDSFGDPGIQPWIGVPHIVEADHPPQISPETRMLEISVVDTEDDEPVQGAQVTLYVPGDMPDPDHDDYASYDEMFMMTRQSDEGGIARFVFEEDFDLETGDMFVTVTGRNILPYFSDLDIRAQRTAIELESYQLTETEGNNNDEINPGETFTIGLTAENLSNRIDVENVIAVASSLSPWVDVDDNEINFGDIAAGEQVEGDDEVAIHVSPSCPDGVSRPVTKPQLLVVFSDDDRSWRSLIELQPYAPHFEVRRVIGGDVIDIGRNDLDVEITNIGSERSTPITAELFTLGLGIGVVNRMASYPAIAADARARTVGGDFLISGNQIAIPGSRASMMMVLTNDDDFVDTVYFDLQVDEPRANAPQGPDDYGYICFDNTDDDWDIAPDYDWIEISRRENDRDFNGIACDFEGRAPHDIGESQVVELGFTTQFYGREYTEITIGTNGFIAMGAQPRITNFQNWPLDRGIGGGVGMVAPLWDDLRITDDSGVYYFYNEDDNCLIVEWYEMRHRNGGNNDLTFQVILYDKDVWITETGDQNILFQYKTVSNIQNVRQGQYEGVWRYDIPFASVGISSPDGTTGISYSFNGQYPVTSARLENRRAILFATSPRFRSGFIRGHVTDVATEDPIQGAVVITEHGFTATTDENGYYQIIDALAEVPFDITASLQSFNDSTLVDLEVAEDETLEVNFGLLHPEFTPSREQLSAVLEVDDLIELDFEVFNGGNGSLNWRAERRLRGDANAPPWDLRRSYQVGREVDDSRLFGVAYFDDRFYVTGANGDGPNTIYALDREGNLINSFEQPGRSLYGMRDLAWDGELLWGSGERRVFGFNTDGEVAVEWNGPESPNYCIAWDPERELLWISGTTTDISAVTRDGEVVEELSRCQLRIYGLSYWQDDPDNHPLYIMHNPGGDVHIVYKMNPENNDTMFVRELHPEEGGRPGGGTCVTNQFDVYSWVYMVLVNEGVNDRIDIWQLDARRDWMQLNLYDGVLIANHSQEFTLTLDAAGLPPVRFDGDIEFFHNADDGRATIPVSLIVLGAADRRMLNLQAGWNMISLNIEPEVVDIVELMQPLTEDELLVMMKDGEGRFYRPDIGFNGIPRWEFENGYQLYLTEAFDFEVEGEIIPPNRPIQLEEGWNLKAYFPNIGIDAITALSGIREQLIIAKDYTGNFYMPAFNYSNIGDMLPGQGYQYKVTDDVELVYQEAEAAAYTKPAAVLPVHFTKAKATGSNMSLLAIGNPAMNGWELGAFSTAGDLIGAGRFDASGRCGLAVWGDNPATDATEGVADGETFSLRTWNGSREVSASIEPAETFVENQVPGQPAWTPDGILAGRIVMSGNEPVEFGIRGAFPNPANGPVRIVFGMIEDGQVNLRLFDLTGREIVKLFDGEARAGYHSIVWDTELVTSGVYLMRLESKGKAQTVKVAVIK